MNNRSPTDWLVKGRKSQTPTRGVATLTQVLRGHDQLNTRLSTIERLLAGRGS